MAGNGILKDAPLRDGNRLGKMATVVMREGVKGNADLSKVAGTPSLAGLDQRLLDRRQEGAAKMAMMAMTTNSSMRVNPGPLRSGRLRIMRCLSNGNARFTVENQARNATRIHLSTPHRPPGL